MYCDPLPAPSALPSDLSYTGAPLIVMLVLAGAFLLAGVLLLVLARNRRGRTTVLVVTLLLSSAGLSASHPGVSSAAPAESSCIGIGITQISPLVGLGPGIPPARITGQITNNLTNTITVATVTVTIASVTKALGAREGTCDASDFFLTEPDMTVNATIEPGGTAEFTGAFIGFNNKSVNQDACQGATVELRYVSSSMR